MTQPLGDFTDADFCSGRWPVNDAPRVELIKRLVDAAPPLTESQRARLAAILSPELPQRTPGQYANDPEWT